MKVIAKEVHENAVADVRNGMSYLQAAEKHGISFETVRQWCCEVDIRSSLSSRRKIDGEILKTIVTHRAITCRELAETLGYTDSGLNKRIRSMVQSGKVQSFRIPRLSRAARNRGSLFSKYINMRIYYVSKDDLAEWVRSQLPEKVLSPMHKYVTQLFRSIDVHIFKD